MNTTPDTYTRGARTTMRRGSTMPEALQRAALAKYVYRYTGNHRPQWVAEQAAKGLNYHVQFADDAEWLAHTWFPVSKDGKRLLAGHCESNPTWPQGR